MEFLRILLLIVDVFCCVLLVGVILLQRAKGEGLGLAFGAGMGETLFGSRAGNVLTRTTIILGFTFLLTTSVLGMLYTKRSGGSSGKSIIDERTPAMPEQTAGPVQTQQPADQQVPPGAAAPTLPGASLDGSRPAQPAAQPPAAEPAPAPAPQEPASAPQPAAP
jgi:preprotein translocase subunit SecG